MPILQLKDGTRLRVAEGANYEAIVSKYKADKLAALQPKIDAQRAADREEYNPTKGMSTLEKLAVGNAQGFARAGRGIANMVGLTSDEDTQAANDLDKPLLDTTAGKIGSFVGNTAALTAATAPVAAAGTAIKGGSALARTLAAGAGNVAAQGALGGAINADPGERAEGAGVGAITGAGTYGVLKGAGRLASGLVKLDPDAAALQKTLGTHIPLSSAASTDDPISRVAKTAYEVAEATPLAGISLSRQRDKVVSSLVSKAADDAIPKSLGLNVKFTPGTTPAERAANQQSMETVRGAIAKAVEPLRTQRVKVNGEFWVKTVGKRLEIVQRQNPKLFTEVQKAIDDALGPNTPEPDFATILDAISNLKALRNQYGGTNNTGQGAIITKVIESFDDLATKRFGKLGKASLPVWQNARKMFDSESWGFENFARGMTEEGAFTPKSLAAGLRGGNTSFDTGKVPGQKLAQLGKRVLVDESPDAPGYFKTMLGLGNLATIGGAGIFGGPVAGVATAAALPALASKGTQRALSGQTAAQQALAEYLRRNPTAIRNAAAAGTAALTPQGN